ncbi:N-acetylmuramoyl-L-alanine amidase family protein [Deinococcus pimensis]|uniref:N-acetylmuramoyl-L-alanine amidase family protein n=1 Tax=Deinococcus pimensis TaxID=309888 RepID=UPI0004BA1BF2|nr:N-acetylmuramoyl-L-alanine amidase [Deinococcus pimensis]
MPPFRAPGALRHHVVLLALLALPVAAAQAGDPVATPSPALPVQPTAPVVSEVVAPVAQNVTSGVADGARSIDARLAAPRVGRHAGFTRVVLDLPGRTSFTVLPLGKTLRVDLGGVTTDTTVLRNLSDDLPSLALTPGVGGATLTLDTQGVTALGGWRAALLPADAAHAARLVLDVSPALVNRAPLGPLEVVAVLPRPSVTLAQQTQDELNVVIDAGHGGRWPGAIGVVTEKDVTLRVALKVRDDLEAAGIHVKLTRDGDSTFSDDLVTDLRLRPGLADANTRAFVSIHCNSLPAASAGRGFGVETWWNPNHPLSSTLAASVQSNVVGLTSAYSRGLKHDVSLAVLRNATVPAALVEIGFVSHPLDGTNLQDEAYLDRVALGIARGVRDTLARPETPLATR